MTLPRGSGAGALVRGGEWRSNGRVYSGTRGAGVHRRRSEIEAADLTLVRGDLNAAPDAIMLSRRTLAIIKGNLFWAFAYNAAAIPLAALGFLSPLIAGAAMAFSSVFVVTNNLPPRRFQPTGDRPRLPG